MAAERRLFIYADGSCLGNPGPGGWGVIITEATGVSASFSGGEPLTTNNRMEITAAIEGLLAIPPGPPLTLRSDSLYLVNTMRLGWKRRQNLDLWEKLDAAVAPHRVSFEWVEGHAGHPLNEQADQLARAAAAKVARLGKPIRLKGDQPERELSLFAPSRLTRSEKPAQANTDVDSRLDDEHVTAKLRPLLRDSEVLARCAGCGRPFVARAPSERFCSLAGCQLKSRQS
ncbi:MAG: ribonuclease H family protein [Candidatus Binataceae bacterium]